VTEVTREWGVRNDLDGRVMRIDPYTGRPFDQKGAERLVRTEKNAGETVESYNALPYRVVYRDVPEWAEYEE